MSNTTFLQNQDCSGLFQNKNQNENQNEFVAENAAYGPTVLAESRSPESPEESTSTLYDIAMEKLLSQGN